MIRGNKESRRDQDRKVTYEMTNTPGGRDWVVVNPHHFPMGVNFISVISFEIRPFICFLPVERVVLQTDTPKIFPL